MHISIQNISKSFGGRDIFSDFSLEVQSGVRLCVCGPNGCGKSTLLKSLAGVETLDAGRVIMPKGCRMGFVMQELDETQLNTPLLDFVLEVLPDWSDFWQEWERAGAAHDEKRLLALSSKQAELEHRYGYNPDQRAKSVLSGLGFAESAWPKPLRALSGGWRERAKLARVLTAGADVLMLDEPTNHLDLDAVEWLESFLTEYQGILIFVAHDRVFMDKVGTHILYMGGQKLSYRKSTFSQFMELQEEFEAQKEREAARLHTEIERKMDFVRRFKAKATKARQAASRQKMAKRLEKELEGLAPAQKQRELDFSWPEPPQPERTVLAVADLSFAFPDGKRMWETLSFNLYRGQKVALVGQNGCGKSTLLKLITGRLEKNGGAIAFGQQVRMGYYSQHQMETLRADGTVLSEIRRLSDPKTTEQELMSVLGLFMLGQHYFDRLVSGLSGGEKSRLILACLFLARCNFLVLDEPTNHLDLESREALVDALGEFQGTILMVAHDRHLLSECAEQIWELHNQGFTVFTHGFDEYNDARRAAKSGSRLVAGSFMPEGLPSDAGTAEADGAGNLSRDDQKKLKREQAEQRNKLYKEQKPVQEAYNAQEKELEVVLARLGQVEALLADPAVYADSTQATELLKEFHALQAQSEIMMEQLGELEVRMAEFEARKQALGLV